MRATRLYEQFDFLADQKKQAERDLLQEARKHPIVRMLETAPGAGCPAVRTRGPAAGALTRSLRRP